MIYWRTDARLTSHNTEFFPLRFKMAESFENLDNILRNWGRKNVKRLVEPVHRLEKQEEESKKKRPFFDTYVLSTNEFAQQIFVTSE